MKKSSVLTHLATNIESSSSTMGNMIPLSSVIFTGLVYYNEFNGAGMLQSTF